MPGLDATADAAVFADIAVGVVRMPAAVLRTRQKPAMVHSCVKRIEAGEKVYHWLACLVVKMIVSPRGAVCV